MIKQTRERPGNGHPGPDSRPARAGQGGAGLPGRHAQENAFADTPTAGPGPENAGQHGAGDGLRRQVAKDRPTFEDYKKAVKIPKDFIEMTGILMGMPGASLDELLDAHGAKRGGRRTT